MATAVDILGYLAAGCTTLSFVPQAVRVLKTGDTRSLSLGMYGLFTLGVLLWLVYGAARRDYAIVGANLFTVILSLVILVSKIRQGAAGRRSD